MSSSSFNRPGAVDLSQLAQRAKQSTQASGPSGGRSPGGSYVVQVTEQTFESEAIRKSVKHPVVVELYSPRVATGQQLSDALIEIANASGITADPVQDFFLERYAEAYRAELDAFLAAIAAGEPPAPSGHDGLMAQRLADAATESARTGAPVRL